ncbi:unnamed protein product [Taenia asiatica]|uniref:Uncharacterized protein n=1 Tax=Taenia asiatica TaxID=60517 RepID=A0A0R3W9S3_TAEAS|nr:unnamed protein product [Taenia asiatica]
MIFHTGLVPLQLNTSIPTLAVMPRRLPSFLTGYGLANLLVNIAAPKSPTGHLQELHTQTSYNWQRNTLTAGKRALQLVTEEHEKPEECRSQSQRANEFVNTKTIAKLMSVHPPPKTLSSCPLGGISFTSSVPDLEFLPAIRYALTLLPSFQMTCLVREAKLGNSGTTAICPKFMKTRCDILSIFAAQQFACFINLKRVPGFIGVTRDPRRADEILHGIEIFVIGRVDKVQSSQALTWQIQCNTGFKTNEVLDSLALMQKCAWAHTNAMMTKARVPSDLIKCLWYANVPSCSWESMKLTQNSIY